MRITYIIARKRDGAALTPEEIRFFVKSYTKGDTPDYQASALLMAIYLRGMNPAETAALTAAMAESGTQLDLSELAAATGKPTLDKHSTGGVGDKTSLVVVPMLAASGALICKMSGRGLGHTGGTLDKLEAIPGFRVELSPEEMFAQVKEIGACLAGQTDDLAPADKKLYALRDATATVGSLPLIISSILSKKLAGGAEAFLFDVKVGNGALMKTEAEARELAQGLVNGAAANGRRAVALLTDMSQPLGTAIGNALEIAESIQTLTPSIVSSPSVDARFRELCLFLTAEGIELAGIASGGAARALAQKVLVGGAALSVFRRLVEAQGGDVSLIDYPKLLPKAPVIRLFASPQSGYIARVETAEIGNVVVALGGGRAQKGDAINPSVGLIVKTQIGAQVQSGEPMVEIHAQTEADAAQAAERIRAAFHFSAEPVPAPPLVIDRISAP